MSIEDIALACSLPGFSVIDPCDEVAMKALVKAGAALPGSVFIRAGRANAPIVYEASQRFEIGKSIELIPGSDVTVIAHGLLVAEAIRASETLSSEGISVRVIDMHTIKPLDHEAVAKAARETGAIVVAEEHLVDGGLGVRVAQAAAQSHPCLMEFVGINDTYAESGTPEALLDKYGLLARDVIAACRKVLDRKRG
jgi:transketolase